MAEPTPFAAGREADLYALDGDRVLRRYRDGGDVTVESGFMAHLHAAGFPVPRVHHAAGPDLVMRRVPGPTLRQPLAAAAGELMRAYLRAIRGHAEPLVAGVAAIRGTNPTLGRAEHALLPAATALVTAAR
ncbi:phosphotransferase family protein [Micromonospora radicis]|uniref:Uncharacterized protein n=1 Tax=Micromonospora radicis TaxID=1894971 RepID=A0A418N1U1_9ACTN|nr:phosphotransferase [Micromonospora radicis]RIV41572.1 hypothetical protein D2L64_02540 [Micromonospora radicis]